MKFNMGCGVNVRDGWVNVDYINIKHEQSDAIFMLWNLEQFDWPFDDNCADHIDFNHVLEHLGQSPKVFLKIMQEIYRIAKDQCVLTIAVPHPRHDDFLGDPTHVRAITPELMHLFSKKNCDEWRENGAANSQLAYILDVDFEELQVVVTPDEKFLARLGKIPKLKETDEMEWLLHSCNNIVKEFRMVYRVIKTT